MLLNLANKTIIIKFANRYILNMHLRKSFIAVWIFQIQLLIVLASIEENDINKCNLSTKLIQEIDSYGPRIESIINETISGPFKGTTWKELSYFVDTFGPRLTGTKVLEKSIDYVLNKSFEFGLENIHGEPVAVPHWVR